ncbi:MAG: NAD(P)/FAD-dependent oxidoreductase [Candidatus Zixiibacteriota bacterium]|nr:MAG: NAD(P)/FAD-dependent oxidoreductase [candidate division Zixibacteria bacterium]
MGIRDVVIVGAGPSGIAVAIQLKRHGIEPVILEKGEIGGLLRSANLVENYPGFPDGISGPHLVELFRRQLANAGLAISSEAVLELEYQEDVFLAKTSRREVRSSIAVVATGTKPKRVSEIRIADGIEDRIFYEVYPMRGIKNQKLVVIGSGDAAFDYALGLSRENDVVILNRSELEKCIPLLRERCMKSETISYVTNVCVREVAGKGNGLLLSCLNGDSQKENQIHADYLVIAAGREPCLGFLGDDLKKSFEDLTKRNKLYLIGDVKNEMYRQTAICVGDGVKAAMQICRKVRGEDA